MDDLHPEERLPDELRPIAEALRDQRPALDPLALDRLKLRAMSRARRPASLRTKGMLMRTRLATLLTVGFLSLGTGGALAWVGGEHFGLDSGGGSSASCTQYRPGNGFGDKNHCHEGPPGLKEKGEPGNSAFGHSHGH